MNELEQRWADLGAFIREQRNLGQMSLRKLSEVAGISNPYLSQIERGLRRPSADILQQIARALSISAETLYVRAGILDERVEQPDPLQSVRADPRLTEDQKKTLVTVYESFLAANASAASAAAVALAGTDDGPASPTGASAAGDGDGAGGVVGSASGEERAAG